MANFIRKVKRNKNSKNNKSKTNKSNSTSISYLEKEYEQLDESTKSKTTLEEYRIIRKQKLLKAAKMLESNEKELEKLIYALNLKLAIEETTAEEDIYLHGNFDLDKDKAYEFYKQGHDFENIDNVTKYTTTTLKMTNDFYFIQDLITEKEHMYYMKQLSKQTMSYEETIKKYMESDYSLEEDFDFFNSPVLSFDNMLITQMEFATPETIVRDFKIQMNNRLYDKPKIWQESNGYIGGVAYYPKHFKMKSDFDWIYEKIEEDYEYFKEKLEEVDGTQEHEIMLSNIKDETIEKIEEIERERII